MYSKMNYDVLNNYLYLFLDIRLPSRFCYLELSESGDLESYTIWNYLYLVTWQILLSGFIYIRLAGKFYYPCIPKCDTPYWVTHSLSWSESSYLSNWFWRFYVEVIINLSMIISISDYTVPGGNNPTGGPCVFPFTFANVVYNSCTEVYSPNRPWCYTVMNGNVRDPWGYCGKYDSRIQTYTLRKKVLQSTFFGASDCHK